MWKLCNMLFGWDYVQIAHKYRSGGTMRVTIAPNGTRIIKTKRNGVIHFSDPLPIGGLITESGWKVLPLTPGITEQEKHNA